MNYKNILFRLKNQIAIITMNRPESFNGINLEMAKEILEAAIRCDADPEIRAVVITGSGKVFSGGGDLKYFTDCSHRLAIAIKELTVYANAYISHFARMEKPVITAINGIAAGGGLSIALSGDLIIAAETATFVASYTGAGLCPDAGMSHFLPRKIGLARSMEMILTNRRIKSPEALTWGIINRCVPDECLMEEVESTAKLLALGPTKSFGMVKRLLVDSYSETLEKTMEMEARGIANMVKTEDAKEGISAFVQKRKPNFNGR